VQEVSNQNEDTKADEDKKEKKAPKKVSWDEVKRKRVNGFLYSPEAYAVEKELQSPYEDSIHEIMNCPVQAGGGGGSKQRWVTPTTWFFSQIATVKILKLTTARQQMFPMLSDCRRHKKSFKKQKKARTESQSCTQLTPSHCSIHSHARRSPLLSRRFKRDKFEPDARHSDLLHVFEIQKSPKLMLPALNRPFWFRHSLNTLFTKAMEPGDQSSVCFMRMSALSQHNIIAWPPSSMLVISLINGLLHPLLTWHCRF
jgi:hypothetical protein